MLITLLAACQFQSDKQDQDARVEPMAGRPVIIPDISPPSLSLLARFFTDMNYSWMHLDEGVPPFLLSKFPQDLNHNVKVSVKKQSFFMGLLPMVLLANQEVLNERKKLLNLLENYESSKTITAMEQQTLERLAEKYQLRGNPLLDHRTRSRLLQRIDIVPPSLALAQAANESGWGNSRFAREGNNLFGEWTFKPGTGIIPNDRPSGAVYEVKKFSSLYDSVRSYLLNINTNSAYLQLRKKRATLRREGQPITGLALVGGLARYSIRGKEYVAEIRHMIKQNHLSRLNRVRLRQPTAHILTTSQNPGSGLLSTRRLVGLRDSEFWQNP